jgi:hypothetical protein
VDWPTLLSYNRLTKVNWVTEEVENASQSSAANWHRDRTACVDYLNTASKAVGGVHRYCANAVVSKVLLDLANQWLVTFTRDGDGGVDRWKAVREDSLDNDALDLFDPACVVLSGCGHLVLVLLLFRFFDG